MSTHTFASLGVSVAVRDALAAREILTPFPIQARVLPDALAGRDMLVGSPTGSGKSLAFGLGLVERIEATDPRPSGLILVPTRELAAQIVEELRAVAHARALAIAAVYGGAGIAKQAQAAAKAHILVATPGRLEDLLARGAVSLEHVRVLILDEADRMLDMGFRPAVERIVALTPRSRQTLMFSATLENSAVQQLTRRYTRDMVRHEQAHPPERRGEVEHRFVPVAGEAKLDVLVRELRHPERGRTLVFVRTKRGADRLVKRLQSHGVQAAAMHGDKTQSQRERALRRFAGGENDLLIATDVAARGLDVDGITHVINFDAPAAREDYVHRVGRTGRAGASGVGITLVADEETREVARIAGELGLRAELAQVSIASTPTRRADGEAAPPRGRSKGGRPGGAGRSPRSGGSARAGGPGDSSRAGGSARLVASARPSTRSRGRRRFT